MAQRYTEEIAVRNLKERNEEYLNELLDIQIVVHVMLSVVLIPCLSVLVPDLAVRMPSDRPLVSSVVVKVVQRQTTVQLTFVADVEMRKEIDGMEEQQEVEFHTVVEVSDFLTAAEV